MKLTDKQKKGLSAIATLDLSDISRRVRGLIVTGAAERDYRRYLALRLLYPKRTIVPTGTTGMLVDALWHSHIIDTRRYADDCLMIFGEFLHHTPGIQPDGTAAALYRETFTASVWGKPDPAIVPFLYTEGDSGDEPPDPGSDGEDCA